MTLIILLTISWMIAHLWFEVFELQFTLKRMFRIPLHKHVKPFDCYMCTHFWAGVLTATVYGVSFIIMWGWSLNEFGLVLLFIALNYLIATLIDHIKYN